MVVVVIDQCDTAVQEMYWHVLEGPGQDWISFRMCLDDVMFTKKGCLPSSKPVSHTPNISVGVQYF